MPIHFRPIPLVISVILCATMQYAPLAYAEASEAAKPSIRYDYLCKPLQTSFKGTSFYSTFLRKAPALQYAFTRYYQDIDDVLLKYNQENCAEAIKSTTKLKAFIENEGKLCKESCNANVAIYHKNDWWWSQKAKMKANIEECENICGKYTNEQNSRLTSLPPLLDHKPKDTNEDEH